MLGPDDAPAAVLAGDEPPQTVDGVAVGVVGRLTEDADRAVALVVTQHPVVGDVREDEVPGAGKYAGPSVHRPPVHRRSTCAVRLKQARNRGSRTS